MRRALLLVLLAGIRAAAAAQEPGAARQRSAPSTPTSTPTSTSTSTPTATPTATATSTSAARPGPASATAVTNAAERAETYVPGKGPAVVPPSLTAGALADELRRASRERKAERTSLAEERVRLEKLESEIAASRAALREETRKLQEMLATGPRPRRAKSGKPQRKGEPPPSPLADLAKTVKGMRPEAAAALLTRLDRSLAAGILDEMRPADAAAVVEKMDPGTSAALFALLVRSAP